MNPPKKTQRQLFEAKAKELGSTDNEKAFDDALKKNWPCESRYKKSQQAIQKIGQTH